MNQCPCKVILNSLHQNKQEFYQNTNRTITILMFPVYKTQHQKVFKKFNTFLNKGEQFKLSKV